MKTILVSGSIAYDNILNFPGEFKEHFLANNLHHINVSFLTPGMRREFGGTAANIAYNIALLGGDCKVLAAVGARDGNDYLERMKPWRTDLSAVELVADAFTAQCFITTDLSGNQITAFHPGAMSGAASSSASPGAIGLVSPNAKDAMFAHAKQFNALQTPYIFDPGQGLPMFNGPELLELISGAQALTVNEYEAELVSNKTGLSLPELARQVQVMIVTHGAEGAEVWREEMVTKIPVLPAKDVVDPTGCGDAFRAGLTVGRVHGWSWEDSCKLGSVMGGIKIASPGAQNHAPTRQQIAALLKEHFGLQLPV